MDKNSMDERFKLAKVTNGGIIHYGLPIPDTLLNDTIREMDAYMEYVVDCKMVVVPMETKIVLNRKPSSKEKPLKEKKMKEKSKKAK
nr:hypothetical protein [Tanacetum cinerariifolium]